MVVPTLISDSRAASLALAGLGAAFLLLIGIWVLEGQSTEQRTAAKVLAGADLVLLQGQGESSPAGLLVRGTGRGNAALAVGSLAGAPRDALSSVSWELAGIASSQKLAVAWVSGADPNRLWVRTLNSSDRAAAQVDLSGNPGWKGQIIRLGLMLEGPIVRPVLIRQLSLAPRAQGPISRLQQVIGGWSRVEPWSQRSINFHAAPSPGTWLTPTSVIALWVGLGLAILAGLSWRFRVSHLLRGGAALLLVGWLALDMGWQWQLVGRLTDTLERYAGLAPNERNRAAPDGELHEALRPIIAHLPAEPAKIFILSDDPGAYLPNRIRYHLLPHRGHVGLSDLPAPSQVRRR